MKIEEVAIHRIQWEETIPIRHQVLWPNESAAFCYVDGDESGRHFGGFVDDQLVSVASVFCKENRARLRKFATLAPFQGKGIGSKMVDHILAELVNSNMTHFWCDARESAVGFYERFGLTVEGDRFYKGEIPYFRMTVCLSEFGRR